MSIAVISSSERDLVESRHSLKKLRIDVEGSMGRTTESRGSVPKPRKAKIRPGNLYVAVIPQEVSVSLMFVVMQNGGTSIEAGRWRFRFEIRFRVGR